MASSWHLGPLINPNHAKQSIINEQPVNFIPVDDMTESMQFGYGLAEKNHESEGSSTCISIMNIKEEISCYEEDQQDVYGNIDKEPNYSSSQGSYEPNEARDEDMALFDQVIINTMREHNIKGGSVVIGQEGKILYRQVLCVFPARYGQDSAGLSATSSSKFPIGDISKVITAIAVLKLKELGYLELDDEVLGNDQTSILKLEQKKNVREKFDRRKRKAPVISRSVQHLLQHSAGWDPAKENDIIGTRKIKLSRKITNLAKCSNSKELVMRQMMFRPSDFQPGTKQVYCHLNFLFLGLMVEELTGMSYLDFISDMFLCLKVGPLEDMDYAQDLRKEDIFLDGLQNKRFCVLRKHEFPAQFLHGTAKEKRKGDELFLIETAAYCGLVASAEQLFKIFSSIELSLFQRSVLSKDSVTEMLERPECCQENTEWYGLGLKVSDNGKSWGHSGRVPEGTHSLAFRDQCGITWTVLFSHVESGFQTSDIELSTMMRHALSVTPRFSSYSSLLFKHVSFLGMEVSFYGIYSSNMDQVFEVFLPYHLIDSHYKTLKQEGYFLHHIDLVNMCEKVYANIVWNKNEGIKDWFIRINCIDNSHESRFGAEEKDVAQIISSGFKVHTVATCATQTSFYSVIVFRKKTEEDMKLIQRFLIIVVDDCSPRNPLLRLVSDVSNMVVLLSVCYIGEIKLLTAVTECDLGKLRIRTEFYIASNLKSFSRNLVKASELGIGLHHVQFYRNKKTKEVCVCVVLSMSAKLTKTYVWGLTRYAFMKSLTSFVKSGNDIVIDKICTYADGGKINYAYVTT